MNKFFKKLRNLFGNFNADKRTQVIFILGIIGILLIFVSSLGDNKKEEKKSKTASAQVYDDTSEFINDTEKRLEELLEDIYGVGDVEVMVNVSGTTEFEYAQELSKDSDTESQSYKNQYVFIENNGEKEALVKKINKPHISGVAVVCKGGDDVKVKERIVEAVSTVLGISSNSICVVPLKN